MLEKSQVLELQRNLCYIEAGIKGRNNVKVSCGPIESQASMIFTCNGRALENTRKRVRAPVSPTRPPNASTRPPCPLI